MTGERYRWSIRPTDPALLVDVLCARCRGCGRAEHDDLSCEAAVHAGDQELRAERDDERDDDPYDDESDDDQDGERCWSCHGAEWFLVTGFGVPDADAPAGDVALVLLRMPCGCTSGRMQLVPDPGEVG